MLSLRDNGIDAGWTEQDLVKLQDAISRHLAANCGDANVHSLRCLVSYFDERIGPAERLALHRDFFATFCAPQQEIHYLRRERKKVRVGYLSISFQELPRRSFVSGLLCHHDADRFDIYLYSRKDRERSLPHVFRNLAGMKTPRIVKAIRGDDLDILVDLDGHRDTGMLEAFASRLAPIQVSMPTYPGSLGLESADYRLTDSVVEGEERDQRYYTERLLRIPCCWNYTSPESFPGIDSSPFQRNRFLTFGIFGQPLKCGLETLGIAVSVLRRIPDARLVFHHPFLGDPRPGTGRDVYPAIRQRLLQPFLDAEIDTARIAFVGALSPWDHLDFHNEVDLLLDTSPFNGVTTTLDAFWMGIPTLCIRGDSFVCRTTAALSSHAGLPQFVCADERQLIEKAVALDGDRGILRDLRKQLRRQLVASPLMDEKKFTQSLELAYQQFLAEDASDHSAKGC